MILAGGSGKRMGTTVPKVLNLVHEKPMIIHILEKVFQIAPNEIIIITGTGELEIKNTIEKYVGVKPEIKYIRQEKALGTGNAVLAAHGYYKTKEDRNLLVLPGDVPLITTELLQELIGSHEKMETRGATMLTSKLENPTGNGRIIQRSGEFVKIQEEKDCSEEQKKIQLVNAGIYLFSSRILYQYLPLIEPYNAQSEYYLTDIFEILSKKEFKINLHFSDKHHQLLNVNTQNELQRACILNEPSTTCS